MHGFKRKMSEPKQIWWWLGNHSLGFVLYAAQAIFQEFGICLYFLLQFEHSCPAGVIIFFLVRLSLYITQLSLLNANCPIMCRTICSSLRVQLFCARSVYEQYRGMPPYQLLHLTLIGDGVEIFTSSISLSTVSTGHHEQLV